MFKAEGDLSVTTERICVAADRGRGDAIPIGSSPERTTVPDFPKLIKAIVDLIHTVDKHRVGSMITLLGGGVVVLGMWVMRH